VIDQFPSDRQAQIRVMLSESLRGVISQTLCRKIGGGRVAALEVLIVTPAISNLIREGKTFQIQSMMQVGRAVGMVTLNDALMDLVTKKLVTPEEAYAKAVDKPVLAGMLKRVGFDPDKPVAAAAPAAAGAAPAGAPSRPGTPRS
jgi:twitching motility protein PilT